MAPVDSPRDGGPPPDAEPAHGGEHARSTEPGLDEGALYVVVRKAVEDAILGAIGTLLLVGLALVMIWVGVAMALSTDPRAGVSPLVAGGAIALVGLYVAAATLEVVPPIREWF